MNKYYFIIPAILLGGFIFLYRGARVEMIAKHKAELAQAQAKKDADDKKQREIEEIAQKDALKRQEERAKEEQAKQEKKEKAYNDAMASLKKETDDYAAQLAKLTKEAAALEVALINGRILRDKTNRESFELSKQVELSKIGRRSAELEIQRLIEMVGTRAGSSSLAAMPPPPPAPKK